MIDSTLLHKLGWSDELINASEQMAKQLRNQQISIAQTEVHILPSQSIRDATTISLPVETARQATWPRF